MAKVYLRKTLAGLVPDNVDAEDALKKVKLGETVSCEIKKPRNYEFHKKFFSMFGLALANQDHFPETSLGKTQFYSWLKLKAGYVDYYKDLINGQPIPEPRSISFASMDEIEFQAFYDDVKDVIFDHVIPSATEHAKHNFEQAMLGY